MLKTEIIHPPLLNALARCGHKTQILIADANYGFAGNVAEETEIIWLNLSAGTVAAPLLLEKILAVINVEKATMMAWPADVQNTIASEYGALLPGTCQMEYLEREAFYSRVKSPLTMLVIASGETRLFANVLLTVAPVITAQANPTKTL